MGTTPCIISTVDTIYAPMELETFLDLNQYGPFCGLILAVTEFVHDTVPLWASVNDDGFIVKLGEEVSEKRYVTAGLYLILQSLPQLNGGAIEFSALREYLQYLVDNHGRVLGKRLHTAIDVDSPEDVRLAESFLKI
jgi:hypothetical protein